MKSRFLVKRIAATFLAVGLLFVLVGDRAMTATPLGIDPLEVLNLQIKPNVLIVLDTSGSMNETRGGQRHRRRPPGLEARLGQDRHAPGPREQREQGQHDVRDLHPVRKQLQSDECDREQRQPGPFHATGRRARPSRRCSRPSSSRTRSTRSRSSATAWRPTPAPTTTSSISRKTPLPTRCARPPSRPASIRAPRSSPRRCRPR